MPKIYWIGTLISGILLLSFRGEGTVSLILPFFLIAFGVTGFIVQSWLEQKRRR